MKQYLVLSQKAILVYKNNLNYKSFPFRPTIVVPAATIRHVTMKEITQE